VRENLGLIGNCQISALVARSGSIEWCCLPRFDSPPVFSHLVDSERGGRFVVGAADGRMGQQRYLENTNVIETLFEDESGAFRVLDFAPRFMLHGRPFRPVQIFRVVEPVRGTPRISVRCDPRLGWSMGCPMGLQGSNHIDFEGFEGSLRLTADLPLTYLGGRPFVLTGRRHLVLTWGAPIEEPLAPLAERFLNETLRYWQRWVKHSNIPSQYQREVIRSALALKLHCFEDTGAIVTSMTTSLPHAIDGGETWDDRLCWMRDAYYALDAFRLLGHFEERERFVEYLLGVVSSTPDLELRPYYRVDGQADVIEGLEEVVEGICPCPTLDLVEGRQHPVEQILDLTRGHELAGAPGPNDVCGEMVLALAPAFLDRRFSEESSKEALHLLERLARRSIVGVGATDLAGVCRCPEDRQTFSRLMCWAAADRTARVVLDHAPWLHKDFAGAAAQLQREIVDRAWNADLGAFVGRYDGNELDPSLLHMARLRFLSPDDPRLRSTVDAIAKQLWSGQSLRCVDDGGELGGPSALLATFWLVEALAATGRVEDAKGVLTRTYAMLSPLGLFAEGYDTRSQSMRGNFPYAPSHVGFIRAAFTASDNWADVL
jgi:GH15 family glucan-1,4-alpha-glucosidase